MSSQRPQPPVHLNALRAFEAAARHLSFVDAAEELHVTPSAISQQIRTLEDYLGIKLFARSASGVALTAAAVDAYPDVRLGLAHLAAALGKLQDGGHDASVTLTVPISFAAKWLMPRMDRFRDAHPGLDLRLDTSNRLTDYLVEGIDIGVRYGFGSYPGLESEKLLDEELFPVCSPQLLPPGASTLQLDQLATMTLIHDAAIDFDPGFPGWRTWLAAQGVVDVDASRGLRFNSTVLAIQAAIDGQGIALGRSVAVAGDLREGRLMRPLQGTQPTRCAYYLLHLPGALAHPKVQAVREWLLAEATRED